MMTPQPTPGPKLTYKMDSEALPRLPDLPTEIVENISGYLDDCPDSWFAFRLTCRAIREKSTYPFGKRFFSTLKFSLHPFSLQGLTDISCNTELASHVRNVAFDTVRLRLIDPVHDRYAKELKQPPLRALSDHPAAVTHLMDERALAQVRLQVDAYIIAQALSRFPKLRLVLVGTELELDGHSVRPSCGRRVASYPFNCTSGHCTFSVPTWTASFVFSTILVALQHLSLPNVQLGVGVTKLGQLWPENGVEELRRRLTHMQITTSGGRLAAADPLLEHIFEGTRIESLVLRFHNPLASPPNDELFAPRYLGYLRRITLKEGTFVPATLTDFFSTHADRLEYVSLISCAIPPRASIFSSYNWHSVILQLQKLSKLSYLNLELLEQCTGNPYDPTIPMPQNLDRRETLHATWRDSQIPSALTYLLSTFRTVRADAETIFPSHRLIADPADPNRLRLNDYVDLRWANFKVSAEHRWTPEEVKELWVHRSRLNKDQLVGLNDPDVFPLPDDAETTAKTKAKAHECYIPNHWKILNPNDGIWTSMWCGSVSTWQFSSSWDYKQN
jgi:hypothetical protein